ncbi:MAG: hypothetical protein GY791_21235 [Alphaproteobacteria bacterium]|nr:hypothetical protein [Alphaproteobacteria bacterium]
MRIFLQTAIPLLLPFALYFGYLYLARLGRGRSGEGLVPSSIPWTWLLVIGVVLAAVSLGAMALVGSGAPGDPYVAPRMEDGKIVPGRFE